MTLAPNLRLQYAAISISVAASGKDHIPPQMPAGGRFSSKTSPARVSASIVVAFSGSAFFGLRPGIAATSLRLRATHAVDQGHASQRGFVREQIPAPRSMR